MNDAPQDTPFPDTEPVDLGVPPIDTSAPPVTAEEDEHVARIAAWTPEGQVEFDPFSGIDPGIRAFVEYKLGKLHEDFERSLAALTAQLTELTEK